MYLYPKDIKEFKDKDQYEIKHWSLDTWTNGQVYSNSFCYGRQIYIKYLIVQNRIRIKQ